MLKTMQKHGVTLAIFAACCTGLTAAVNQLTKSTIEGQAALQQKTLFDQVVPPSLYDNDLNESCYVVNEPALKARTASILRGKTINRLPPLSKPPRPMATPARSSCWWARISTAPSPARASLNITKRQALAIKSSCGSLTGSWRLAVNPSPMHLMPTGQ